MYNLSYVSFVMHSQFQAMIKEEGYVRPQQSM